MAADVVAGSGNPCKPQAPRGIPSFNSERPLQAGDLLRVDGFGPVRGYGCDLARSTCVGAEPTDAQREVLEHAVEFVDTLVGAVRPGVTHEAGPRPRHRVAGRARLPAARLLRGLLARLRPPDRVDHRGPFIAAEETEPLQAGQTMSIEIVLGTPETGGISHEESFIVTADGTETITAACPPAVVVSRTDRAEPVATRNERTRPCPTPRSSSRCLRAPRRCPAARSTSGASSAPAPRWQRPGSTRLLAFGSHHWPWAVRWLADHQSGFFSSSPADEKGYSALLLPVAGAPILLIDQRALPGELAVEDARTVESIVAGLAAAIRELGLVGKRVGIVGEGAMLERHRREVEDLLGERSALEPADRVVEPLMRVKSAAELDCLRYSSAVGSAWMKTMMEAAEPGRTEADLVAAGLPVLVAAGGFPPTSSPAPATPANRRPRAASPPTTRPGRWSAATCCGWTRSAPCAATTATWRARPASAPSRPRISARCSSRRSSSSRR